jgi:hypothetical protein
LINHILYTETILHDYADAFGAKTIAYYGTAGPPGELNLSTPAVSSGHIFHTLAVGESSMTFDVAATDEEVEEAP